MDLLRFWASRAILILDDTPQWKLLLTEDEKEHFHYGFWNEAIKVLNDKTKYLENRYM